MDSKIINKIKNVISVIYTEDKKIYLKHQTICISIKIQLNQKGKSKFLHSFLYKTQNKIKKNIDNNILFFGSKNEYEKLSCKNLIYGNDVEPKTLKKKKYLFCVVQDKSVLGKHKGFLTKNGILTFNQYNFNNSHELINGIQDLTISKCYQQNNSFNCKIGDILTNNESEITENIKSVITLIENQNYNIEKIYIYKNMCKAHVIYTKFK